MGGMVSGCSQEALITHPVLTEDTDFPVIIFAHGMTVGGWKLYPAYVQLLRNIASRGFIIVSPLACCDLWCDNFADDIKTAVEKVVD